MWCNVSAPDLQSMDNLLSIVLEQHWSDLPGWRPVSCQLSPFQQGTRDLCAIVISIVSRPWVNLWKTHSTTLKSLSGSYYGDLDPSFGPSPVKRLEGLLSLQVYRCAAHMPILNSRRETMRRQRRWRHVWVQYMRLELRLFAIHGYA